MALFYEALKFVKECLPNIVGTNLGPGGRIGTAMLGYQDVVLSVPEARELLGEDSKAALWMNSFASPGKYGLRAVPFAEVEASLSSDARDCPALEERPGSYHNAWFRTLSGKDKWQFETLSVFSAMNCYCRIFDIIPYYGVERRMDLNRAIASPYHGQFDLAVECGTSEHCFHPGESIANSARLVRKGGVVIHILPLNHMGHGFYNFDPALFHDFYITNGFTILDCFYRLDDAPAIRYAVKPGSQLNYMPQGKAMLWFAARKEQDLGVIRTPAQSIYAIYGRYSQAYTFAPLLTESDRAEPAAPWDNADADPVYDSIMRQLALLCGREELTEIRSDQKYRDNPYLLSDCLEKALLSRTEAALMEEARRLVKKEVFFWIADKDMYERRRKLFDESLPLAALTSDPAVAAFGASLQLENGTVPLKSLESAIKASPGVPVVLFANRGSVTQCCRTLLNLFPSSDIDLVACWL